MRKLRDEFDQAKRFYVLKLRPYLLQRHGLSEERVGQIGPRHAFRAADLVVAAVHNATDAAQELQQRKLGPLAQGLGGGGLPGLF